MYATIRRYTVKDPSKANAAITDFKSRIETKFFPMLNELPGLHAYHVLNTNNSELVTISIFETRDGADHSTLRAAEFVRTDPIRDLLSAPEIIEGEVLVSREVTVGAH